MGIGHPHHHHNAQASDRRLVVATAVNVLLTAAQLVGGLVSGSLSLVADALHNLSDAAALGVALTARRLARRPADETSTFGYRKAELIGALINTTALCVAGLYLAFEAVWRLLEPREVTGWIVVWLAGLALAVDTITAVLTYRMSKGSANVRAAFVHNLSDALSSIGVIVAGTLILLYRWYWADVVATLMISAYILWQGGRMMRSSIRMLMDRVPEGLNLQDMIAAIRKVEGVRGVHHVHVWPIGEHQRAMEAHVVVERIEAETYETIKRSVKTILHDRFDIAHATLELEDARHAGPHDTAAVPEH